MNGVRERQHGVDRHHPDQFPTAGFLDWRLGSANRGHAGRRQAYSITAHGQIRDRNVFRSPATYHRHGRARLARKRLANLPKGRFRGEDFLDEGGSDGGPLPVHVDIEITDEEFKVDFMRQLAATADLAEQHASGNGRRPCGSFTWPWSIPITLATTRAWFRAVGSSGAGGNYFRQRPAARARCQSLLGGPRRPTPPKDLVWKALAPAVTDRLTAGHFLSVVRRDRRRRRRSGPRNPLPWSSRIREAGAPGRTATDRAPWSASPMRETFVSSSVEVIETATAFLADRYELNTAQGAGAGKYRGGFGIVKDYRILNSSVEFTTDNQSRGRPGLAHGQAAALEP